MSQASHTNAHCVRVGLAWVSAEQLRALLGDAKQATSEGKSGLVETGLTRPVATALLI